MYKWFITLMALYLAGDPELVYLEQMGAMKDILVTLVLSLVVVPWIVSQFDN